MGSFERGVKDWCKKTGISITTAMRKTAIDLGTRIDMRTPVDTGMARGNWQSSTGQPKANIIDRKGSTVAEIQQVAGQWQPEKEPFYIANNLPYINRLENGWSQQTPPGVMVAQSIMEAEAVFDE